MYEDFYHLKAKPFRLSPDPGFFFASRGHKRALAYLRYGLSQDEGFVVITGAPGTGKTTLAQILLKEMDQSDLVIAHLTTTQLDADEMLRMVAASFGLRYDGVDKASLLKVMESFLKARSRERKRVLLVIDEAQNLPPQSLEELRMLSNLQVGEKALVQTFLLGQPQFRNMLDHPDLEQLRQRVIANYHLSELAEDECQNYIETRLRHVDWHGDPKITAAAYDGIYQYTQGVPRRINMLCDRLMLFSCLEERHEIDNSVLRDVTDELQQEISGKPIKRNDLVDGEVKPQNVEPGQQSDRVEKETNPEVNHENEESLEAYFGADFSDKENSVEELETQNQDSAYVSSTDKMEDAPLETDSDHSPVEIAVPDDGYDNPVMQMHKDGVPNDDISGQSAEQNKDRFQVIDGGRGVGQASFNGNVESDASMRPVNNPSSKVMSPIPDAPTDSDEVVLRKILRLVLAYHRSPRSFPGLDDSTQLLPNGIKQILSLAVSDDETLKNLRQISVMGISPSMLRAAVRFFVRRVLFLPGGDDYRVLGLADNASKSQVEEHYGLLMRLMRHDKKGSEDGGVSRIGESYERLCQGEITHEPEESPEKITSSDIEDLDELDLDLAPNIGGVTPQGSNKNSKIGAIADVVMEGERTGPTGRNIMLIIGTVVIVFVLYFTQISESVNPNTGSETANVDSQRLANSGQQGVGVTQEQVRSSGGAESSEDQIQESVASTRDVLPLQAEEIVEQNTVEDEKAQRQRILMELRAESDVLEKSRREAEVAERVRLEAELEKAAKARAVAEAKAQQEAEARAKAEAAAIAALQAKAEAEAKARAVLKVKQDAAKAKEKSEAEAKAALKAKQDAADTKAKVVAAAKVESKAVVVQEPAKSGNNRIQELKTFITKLENAYVEGNLDNFLSLFSSSARTNDQTDLVGIRKDYKSLFDNTSSRKISLRNIDWKLDNNYARGNGEYEVVVHSKDASSTTTSKGKVTIQLEGRAGRSLITRFYFSESASSKKAAERPETRTSIAELNQTLEKFARTYKEGNIEQFMALFSPDASTNDRSTLEGIRGDYVELFAGTGSRRLDYTDMQWQWEGDVANGIGAYVVTVQPKGKDKADIYRGKLRFSIKRIGDKLLISRFVFE